MHLREYGEGGPSAGAPPGAYGYADSHLVHKHLAEVPKWSEGPRNVPMLPEDLALLEAAAKPGPGAYDIMGGLEDSLNVSVCDGKGERWDKGGSFTRATASADRELIEQVRRDPSRSV